MKLRRFLPMILLSVALIGFSACSDSSSPTTVEDGNRAPGTISANAGSGAPADGATDVGLAVTLAWSCTDSDGDALTYAVHFGTSADPALVASDLDVTTYTPATLQHDTTYHWKVVASDPDDATSSSPVWSFATIAQAVEEAITAPSTGSSTTSADLGLAFSTFAVGATSNLGHAVELQFDWGDGSSSDWRQSTTREHTWTSVGSYDVRAHARCVEHPDVVSDWSNTRTITVLDLETVSPPDVPNGAESVETGTSVAFSTGGAVSSRAHTLEYRFDWGNGSMSAWSTSASTSYTWNVASDYEVRAQARCATHPEIESDWSDAATISIHPPAETVSRPGSAPSGPANGALNGDVTFTIPYPSVSSDGHAVEHRFDWGDGTYSTWSASLEATHAWSTIGNYEVRSQGRCAEHVDIVSDWSGNAASIAINDDSESVSPPSSIHLSATIFRVNQQGTFYVSGSESSYGHEVEYRLDWGDGMFTAWQASPFYHTYTASGSYDVTAQARCTLHPEVESAWSAAETIVVDESLTPMGAPTTTSELLVGQEIIFHADPSESSDGHTLEYNFYFATTSYSFVGPQSGWSTSTSAAFTYPTPGQRYVRVRARCAEHQTVITNSPGLPVSITEPVNNETISTPSAPVGPALTEPNVPVTFTTSICTSTEGHAIEYQFKAFLSGFEVNASEWSSDPSGSVTLTSIGNHGIVAYARCAEHPEKISEESPVSICRAEVPTETR